MQLTVKYFFLPELFFWGAFLGLDKYILLWQGCFM
jgi:hypothetical protein